MLRALLRLTPPAVDSLDAWWAATRTARNEMMTTAEMVTYAFDQIDQARAELNAVSD